MRREDFIKFCLTGVYIFIIPESLFAKKDDDLPNVLLIGDSISVGYTPFVQELLMGKANVFRPMLDDGKPENCSGTTNGVTEIDRWIGLKEIQRPNNVHFTEEGSRKLACEVAKEILQFL